MKLRSIHRSQGFKNIKWNLVASLVYPVAMFLATPVFLHKLGSGHFGLWVLITTILQLMGAFNFGLGDANIKFIAEHQAKQDHKSTVEVVSSTFGFSLLISAFVVVIGFIASYVAEGFSLIDIPLEYRELSYVTFRITCVLFVFRFTEVTLLSIFQGFGRYDLSSRLSIVSRLGVLAANLASLYAGLGLVGILISSLIGQTVFVVIEIFFLRRRYAFLDLRPDFSLVHVRRYLSFGIWTWIQTLLAVVTTQVDKVTVAALSGLETLSYYSIGSMLAMQFHTIFISLSNWVFPIVSEKTARNEPLLKFYKTSDTLLLSFGYLAISGFLLFSEPIVRLWLGADVYAKAINYIRLFSYYNLFLLLNIIPYFFLNGSNHPRQNAFSEFVLKAANILGMVVGYKLGGNEGLIWGLIASSALTLPMKISQLRVYALKVPNTWFGIDGVICSILLVVVYDANSLWIKAAALLVTLGAFYFIYVRNSSISETISSMSLRNFKK